MSGEPQYIGIDESLTFSCGPHKGCFNQCCCDVNQFLYPYDILRLSRALGVSTGEFIETYTYIYIGDTTGLPVVSFKTSSQNNHACPFVTEQGCSVYEDRPASCRIFPLARALARSREDGTLSEYFAVIEDPICEGFQGGAVWTPRQWVKNQGLTAYNERNDKMIELISLKQQVMPGRLEGDDRKDFELACYDLDGFRARVADGTLAFEEGQKKAILEDDDALLHGAMDWLRERLFGTRRAS
ncbi:YkgJ family cysteine cluster protein [Desulfoluna sp.]|uniref:YkgJ family cysteine cluster protein n=1 Tax=Desulfoluna sp. TaxID=2045199 RepID=UPI002610A858|nr:YkgJ family cysteine cluster protein [Desulfoluna sp.]